MKISSLYIKIFLSFLGILFITEIIIFGLFFRIAGRAFQDRFAEYTTARVVFLKEIVADKLGYESDTGPAQKAGLKEFINHFAETFSARVWLVDGRGRVLVKTFPEPAPEAGFPDTYKWVKDYGSFRIYRLLKGPYNYFTHISIDLPQRDKGSLNLLYLDRGPPRPEKGFAWGLFFIGIIIALLCIPVSRLITQPIKRLGRSALQIAEGDLSHRAEINSRDELGELGRAFNRMADQLERMIRGGRELTANVSHELRSPLARIRMAEEILREKCDQAGFRQGEPYLNDIQEEIMDLDRLIDRILYLSKLDVHGNHIPQEKIDLKSMIEGIVDRHYSFIRRKQFELILDLEDGIWLPGDRSGLLTAMSNIVDNAVKFTAPGGTIRIKTWTSENDLWIEFTNQFSQLPEVELDKIFEPFYRSGSVPEAAGSGLGLAIVKKIICSQGGEIGARNTPEGLMIYLRFSRQTD